MFTRTSNLRFKALSIPTMPYPSNALTLSQVSALAPSASNPAQRIPPDVLTYSYATRMVYVTPGETYDVRSFGFRLKKTLC